MPKVSTKRKRKATNQEVFDNPAFPDLPYDASADIGFGDDQDNPGGGTGGKPAANGHDDQMAALLQQIGAMNQRFEDQQQQLTALMTQAPQYTAPTPPPAPPPAPADELPDPAIDPEGYSRALQERILKGVKDIVEANANSASQQQQRTSRTDGLWSEFEDLYPDYADNPDRMEFIANQVARKAKDRGIDVERYMFATRGKFMKDLTAEYDKVFGSPVDPGTGDDDDEDTGDTNRTGGIFGGLGEGGQRMSGGRQEAPSDMIKELQEMQRKRGIY